MTVTRTASDTRGMSQNGTGSVTPMRELVAEELRVLLARRRMSASELGRRIGVTQPYISRRLTGEIAFDLDDLQRIADAMGVTIADLLPRSQRVATLNGSSTTLADQVLAPHPVDPRSGVVHPRHRRTGRTGKSLQKVIGHSHAVA